MSRASGKCSAVMKSSSGGFSTIFLGLFSLGKIVFWLKHFFGALFTKVKGAFLKSLRKRRILLSLSTYSKKKSFVS
jgi:hypothetical protein